MTLTAEVASEYDFMILLDASGSMGEPSKRFPGQTRWTEAQESMTAMARFLDTVDADGIDVIKFGASTDLFEHVTADKVKEIFATTPRGSTPLHNAVKLVVEKQQKTGKNTIAIVLTDGIPDNREEVARLITEASNKLDRDEQLTFLFVQVGDDAGAKSYLASLDDDLTGKFDIVDAVTAEEADKYEPLDLLAKAIAD